MKACPEALSLSVLEPTTLSTKNGSSEAGKTSQDFNLFMLPAPERIWSVGRSASKETPAALPLAMSQESVAAQDVAMAYTSLVPSYAHWSSKRRSWGKAITADLEGT